MKVMINEKMSDEEINALLEKVEPAPKLFDAKKYFNTIAFEDDPLKIQQEMRDD